MLDHSYVISACNISMSTQLSRCNKAMLCRVHVMITCCSTLGMHAACMFISCMSCVGFDSQVVTLLAVFHTELYDRARSRPRLGDRVDGCLYSC